VKEITCYARSLAPFALTVLSVLQEICKKNVEDINSLPNCFHHFASQTLLQKNEIQARFY
jgi:hypothetical protein